jgi:DNA invertase Pin-like site-specific DNA recombinase
MAALTVYVTIYLRISSDPLGLELGVDRQEEACRSLCARMGWVIIAVIRDNDMSATSKKPRKGFEKLLISRPDHIVMWSVDRLVRKGADLERLILLDVPIHSVMAGPMDLATASGRLNARLLTSVATFEGEIKAERQKAAHLQRVNMGKKWWPRRPFGFEMDGTLRKDEAKALRKAYADLLQGIAVTTLAKNLNEAGHMTNRGKPWSQPSLRVVLGNARNAAIMVYNGDEIGPARWKPIVSEDTFRAAARLLNSPSRKTGGGGHRTHLLTGILKCHVCHSDGRMQWVGIKGAPGAYAVYTCRAKAHFTTRVLLADAYVSGHIVEWLDSDEGRAVWAGINDTEGLEGLKTEWASLRNQADELTDMWKAKEVTRAQFAAMNRALQESILKVEQGMVKMGQGYAESGGGLMDPDRIVKEWDSKGFGLEKQRIVIEMAAKVLEAKPRGKGIRNFDGDRDIVIEFFGEEKPERHGMKVVA